MGQDEGVLADHAQKARPGIAAHLAEALGQRRPQPDDVARRPAGKPRAEAAVLLGQRDHHSGVGAHGFELAPMADQPLVGEQRLERLVRHRPHPPRFEPAEHLLEGRPFRVDHAVPEPGAKDPQRHLRQIAVVAERFELGRAARLHEACRQRRSMAGLRRFEDRGKRRCGHRSLAGEISTRFDQVGPPSSGLSLRAKRSNLGQPSARPVGIASSRRTLFAMTTVSSEAIPNRADRSKDRVPGRGVRPRMDVALSGGAGVRRGHGGRLEDQILAQRGDGYQGHAAGSLNRPLVVLFQKDGADQAGDCRARWEDAEVWRLRRWL